MTPLPVRIGFMPLVDAAPLIAAVEMGFAEEEGLTLHLERNPSWSSLRDHLCFGHLDAAHMLSPVPVASALGLGGAGGVLHALSVLSVNGNVIGVSQDMARQMRAQGHDFAFNDATAAGNALIRAKGKSLRIGVPFPFSMHAELVYYWLSALGVQAPQDVTVRTVPPPLMTQAMEAGELDAFCVGEPWGSSSVEGGVAELLLPCAAIWSCAPEKVLAVRADWADEERELSQRLIRTVWRASRWLADEASHGLITEIMSQQHYLGLTPDIIEPALRGNFTISPSGEQRRVDGYVEFFKGAAGFPWRSQAEWIGLRLAARTGLDRGTSIAAARSTFRSDLYRTALQGIAHDLPSASDKVEGATDEPTAVGSMGGRLILGPNRFFDGRDFVPVGE